MPAKCKYAVSIYATKNRRAPIIGLIGQWPHRSGFFKMAMAGQRIIARPATKAEETAQDEAPRHLCVVWSSVLDLVRWHRKEFGKYGQGVVVEHLRRNWSSIKRCLDEGSKKATKHARKLAERREAAAA
jgi:hypothetical protein